MEGEGESREFLMEDGQPLWAVQVEESLGAIPNSHVCREDEAETSGCSGGPLVHAHGYSSSGSWSSLVRVQDAANP